MATSLNVFDFSEIAVPILVACFPLVWMALSKRNFYSDWYNHLWMIGYTGEYLRRHLAFPLVLNTDQVVGVPFPIFYGTLLYAVGGIISAVTGAGAAMRIVLGVTSWLQTISVTRLVRAVYPDRYVSWSVAAIVSFGIYPLTNLYNRSAITEYVAVSLLVSACSTWLRFSYSGDRRGAWISASFAWLLLVFSAGAHPITALLGAMFFGALILGSFVGAANRLAAARLILIHVALFVAALSPWLYATLRFYRSLSIVNDLSSSITVYADSIDLAWARVLPIPFDIRPLQAVPASGISTPYLDAQINFGLLVIVCFLFYQAIKGVRTRKDLATFEMIAATMCAVLFVLLLCVSVSPHIWDMLPRSVGIVQFSYRLVTYCDLSLLGAVVFLLTLVRSSSAKVKHSVRMCVAVSVALMTQCVFVKFNHAAVIQQGGELEGTGLSGNRDLLKVLPASFYGLEDYVVQRGFGGLSGVPTVPLPTSGGVDFGKVQSVSLERGGGFATNIQAFPWNRVVLNGRPLPQAETYVSANYRLAARAISGGGRVGYQFIPDPAYVVLREVSGLVLLVWAGVLFLATVAHRRNAGKMSAAVQSKGSIFGAVLRGAVYAGLPLVAIAGIAGVLPFLASTAAAVVPDRQPAPGIPGGRTILDATLRVKFPRDIPMARLRCDPLVVTGATGAGDVAGVAYVGPNLVRFRIDHWGFRAVESGTVGINPDEAYVVNVVEGQYGVVIKLNGIVMARFDGMPYPTAKRQVTLGRNKIGGSVAGEEFSGEILSAVAEMPTAPPKISVTIKVQFPGNPPVGNPKAEPLVVTGAPGAGELVSVRYETGNRVRFLIDHWGAPPVWSDSININPGRAYLLDVIERDSGTSLSVDGVEVAGCGSKPFPTTRNQIALGENWIGGGTTGPKFSGKILTDAVTVSK
jgi:hypothetical protein